MGIASFTLHRVMGWFAGRPRKTGRLSPSRPLPARPLRVVRVMEPTGGSAGAGRMFMSGRMADVCAELDRLAALEAN